MKLKTLNDLVKEGLVCASCALREKAEAIKWVKHWEEVKKNRKDDDHYNLYSRGVIDGQIHALTKFHNITEEDLK